MAGRQNVRPSKSWCHQFGRERARCQTPIDPGTAPQRFLSSCQDSTEMSWQRFHGLAPRGYNLPSRRDWPLAVLAVAVQQTGGELHVTR